MPVSVDQIRRLAGFELNALRASEVLGEEFEKVNVPRTGTPIYDINGKLLFYRLRLKRGRMALGYTDIAVNEVLGEPLLAVSISRTWDEKALLEEGKAMAHKGRRRLKFDKVRFVAYSFPKIALQFLLDGVEVLMLELYTWVEVPPARPQERKPFEPSNFERWSLIDEMPAELKRARLRSFKKRLVIWETPDLNRINPEIVQKDAFRSKDFKIQVYETREIHYSPRPDDHSPCYELRGQQTHVWCVAASVEMLLNFYRYQYDQPRLAQEMDLGTCADPNGLLPEEVHKVVDTIESLSSQTLDATEIANPAWNIFQTEIQANRPLISFIPGHSRTVAGYTRSRIWLPPQLSFTGLLVYDPSPATDCAHPEQGGVITRWENFATQTYRFAFTAVLQHV